MESEQEVREGMKYCQVTMTGWNWGEQGHLTGTFDEETQQLYKHPETIWLVDRQFVQN